MFKKWLAEMEDKGYNYYKNIILGKLNLDHMNGLSQAVDTWEPEQLINILNGLGEFKQLPLPVQDQVISQIQSGTGTLGDLIQTMTRS